MRLDDSRKRRIEDLCRDHHLAFIVAILGPDAVSEEEYRRVKSAGFLGRRKLKIDAATVAHILGALTMDTEGEEIAKALPTKTPDLSLVEREAISIAKERIGTLIRGLGDKLANTTRQAITEAEGKARMRQLTKVRREVAEGISSRRSIPEVAARLAAATKDASRDWQRIAATEIHNAMDEGRAHAIVQTGVDPDPLVYKRPRPDACSWCNLLYLDGKRPRIFRLSELTANGTNVGRRAKHPTHRGVDATEWRAVIGATHPWCQCSLHRLAEGMAFDQQGNLTYVGVKKSLELVEELDRELLNHECDHG
jgi:hypothetical protein